ncbi:hypothetical protein PACTADRAFT_32646 [Pachysolen tannophilus NRRL Y-2460]|uniref:ABC transporter domain-containing protein n=1 Tax=Pachysolen tannophilus NRRL Y-2460 TaxID=669874 RepID=A0A1E4TZJ5_PACTA|nr:hypothetical protein PACTADRAFT_32646 [Pachysolen tannophilus NRRL Y-2460]
MSSSAPEGDEVETISVVSTFNEVPGYQGFSEEEQRSVRDLARKLTNESASSLRRSETSSSSEREPGDDELPLNMIETMKSLNSMADVPGVNTFAGGVDPRLDPYSDQFDSKFWIKNLKVLRDQDPEYYKPAVLGVGYKNLRCYGVSVVADYQDTLVNLPGKLLGHFIRKIFSRKDESRYFSILKPMDALIKPGELTVVLGRPGSGCSTLLKTISAHTYGFHVDKNSIISYDGISQKDIIRHYRGDVVYSAETDVHFPHLTVGQTLEFAARLRTPENRVPGISREQYAKHMTAVYMAMYGLSHTYDSKVGNELVRGISGGERKRVSIAEVALSSASLQCWDNSTRGLDSATALEFIKALKASASILDATPLIAIYQGSQDAYDLFDKAIVLYEGRQIYFGSTKKAKKFFSDMGYECPQRQTTADFLTSMTNPAERIVKPGFENKVPRTAEEFEKYWRESPDYKVLIKEIDEYLKITEVDSEHKDAFKESHIARQSKHIRPSSSYTVSYFMQIKNVMRRNFQRTRGDPSITLTQVLSNSLMSLVISSIFYDLQPNTSSFFFRCAAMFTAVLFNSFSSLLEVMTLFDARPIVEKHKQYALYHPSADGLASVITESPPKLVTSLCFNLILYFMVNFRRSPGHFFFYYLIVTTAVYSMSHIYRTIASASKTLSQAMTPASILLLAFSIYAGFVLPTPSMLGWSRWINYLNPVGYAFEAMMTNEFVGRTFTCSEFIPSGSAYDNVSLDYKVCSVVGSVAGYDYVNGTTYLEESYDYRYSHRWRNWGIMVGFVLFFLGTYLGLIEFNRGAMQKGDITLFQRSTLRKLKKEQKNKARDIEAGSSVSKIFLEDNESEASSEDIKKLIKGKDIFHWRNVCYDIKVKNQVRRILSNVDGWVKPGTLTALMGATGAGKTTLLDVLASRVTMGVVTGDIFVNGRLRDSSFQRSTGYAQQQDLHLETSTVREALRFSAYLRQPASVSKSEKESYVESVISILEMSKYANAVVGVSGEGLNVEQRKRLTIGVELAAKPELLLFLDEPTSGLDSQTAWSICKLIRKLADHGQAVLCTIHQPSAILLQEFDRLLFLKEGGKTVYFGDLGPGCETLIKYFESHGSAKFPKSCNPAEFMLEIIGAAPGSHPNKDYHQVWLDSEEHKAVIAELEEMERELVKIPVSDSAEIHKEFAAPLYLQYIIVTRRVFQQYWRKPSYLWSKLLLSTTAPLFDGFSFFHAKKSLQGLQNQMFSIFMFLVTFNTLNHQMLPNYVSQRDLYEARERPSKTFSWLAFICAQITVEIPWQILCGTIAFFCYYYPVGLYNNASTTQELHERGALFWLLSVAFYVFTMTFGQACIAGIEISDNAANIAMVSFTMCLLFCGVLATPTQLPGFWIFMYRVSPFTYLVGAMLATAIGNSDITCSDEEYVHFDPPSGLTCGEYMEDYIDVASGYLLYDNATSDCSYCTGKYTNTYLEELSINYSLKWRNYGIFLCYIFFNIAVTICFYWLFRVPKSKNRVKEVNKATTTTKETENNQSEKLANNV